MPSNILHEALVTISIATIIQSGVISKGALCITYCGRKAVCGLCRANSAHCQQHCRGGANRADIRRGDGRI